LVYTAERTLREQGDKIPADLKQEVEGKIAAVRSALQGTDINYLRSTTEELSQAMQKIGAAVYGQAGASPPPGEAPGGEAPGGPPGGEEGTVEGEFREV
jgi:molecular chaperone DnaK